MNKKNREISKEEIKSIRKERKNLEKEIISEAPENAKPILCKHLYDDTFLLLLKEYHEIPYKYYKERFNVNVYIKHVPKAERNNVDVSFTRFLPEEMRQKYIKRKNDHKNKRRM